MPPEESSPRNQDQSASSQSDEQTVPEQEYEDQVKSGEDPDVLLDVPVLKIEELNLELEDLRAHVSLRADLADLVNVGVDAYLDKVKLEIKGVEAQVLLKVRLDRVLDTFNHALNTIDRNPEIVGGKARKSKDSGDAVAENLAPNTTVLGEAVGRDGGTVVRSVDEAGELMETVLDDSGAVTDEKIMGSVGDLPVENEYVDDEGRTVSRSRDDLGNVVERTLDEQGNVVGLNVPESRDDSANIETTAAAEKKARELGVDLTGVKGTGSGGRILVKDIEEAAGKKA